MFFPEPFFILFGLRSRSSGKEQHDIRYSVQTACLPWYPRYLQTWAVLALRRLAVSQSRSLAVYATRTCLFAFPSGLGVLISWVVCCKVYLTFSHTHDSYGMLHSTASLAPRANDPRATKRGSLADRDERKVRHQTSIFRRSRLGSALKRSREKVETRRARELVTVGTGEGRRGRRHRLKADILTS